MDLQGTPTKGGSTGTKVSRICCLNTKANKLVYMVATKYLLTGSQNTSDAARRGNPTKEGAGAIANDSLAAESVRGGGKFAENKDSAPMSVEGGKSTLANTGTSGASKLPAARDSEARKGGSQREVGNAGTSSASSGGQNSESHGGDAPNYVQPVLGATQASKPKGKNLTEGGFDSDPAHNASFNSEIGTKNDPGRAAEGVFNSRTAQHPEQTAGAVHRGTGLAGTTARQTGQNYEALGSEQEA